VKDGLLIQEQHCPRCAIRRTVHLADGSSFCFNCRLHWSVCMTAYPAEDHTLSTPPPPLQPFTGPEQVRLMKYRAAVRAGLYTDWPEDAAAA
jgi:hypothetical protein